MKKLPLIANIILAVAVVVLFILHFTSKSGASIKASGNSTNVPLSGSFSAAWVNMDTLLNNYDMYFDMRKELEESGRKLEAELNNKSKDFEKQAMDFQDKVQKGLVTRSQAQQMQQDLQGKEQELYRLRDELRGQLAEEEQVKLRQIHQSITDFLAEFNKDKGYYVILSNTFGGPVLYGHPAIDVTRDVIKGINSKYISEKKK